jgi:hypothetical protein
VALSELGMTANPPTRGVFYRVVLALGVALVAACSNQQSPTGPSSTPPPAPGGQTAACSFSVAGAGTEREVDAAGAAFTLDVTASRADCTWTATSAAPFISTNPAGATGTASIDVLVARNSEAARTGEVTVAGYSLTVRQRAAQAPSMCGAIVSPTAVRVSADGGTTQIAVTNVAKFCAWTASTDAPFLRLTSRLPQEGDGSVTVAVERNDGRERVGSMVVAGTLVTVTQAASSVCVTDVRLTPSTVPATGGTISMDVTAEPGCTWQVSSSESFVSVTAGGSGTGNGSATLAVSANTAGTERRADVSAGGRRATITQAAETPTTPEPPGPTPPAPPSPPAPPPAPTPLPSPGAGTQTLFSLSSDPGSGIGAGASFHFTSANARFEVRTEGNGSAVYGEVHPNSGLPWSIAVGTAGRLTPGLYEGATRLNMLLSSGNGLMVSGNGAGCNESVGRFRVHTADFTPAGTLRKLHVTFEQFCDGRPAGARGEFVMIVAEPAVPPPTPGVTTSRMSSTSDPGDYVGAGQSQTWTAATAQFDVKETAWGIELALTPNGEPYARWNMGMAVNGLAPGPGSYEQAGRYPVDSSGPAFSMSGEGRGCNTSTSTFVIHDLTRTAGQITRLHVTFEQRCDDKQAALRGEWIYVRP